MEAKTIGLPELVPGKFIELKDMGEGIDNSFYLTTVEHRMDAEGNYTTHLTGKAAKLK